MNHVVYVFFQSLAHRAAFPHNRFDGVRQGQGQKRRHQCHVAQHLRRDNERIVSITEPIRKQMIVNKVLGQSLIECSVQQETQGSLEIVGIAILFFFGSRISIIIRMVKAGQNSRLSYLCHQIGTASFDGTRYHGRFAGLAFVKMTNGLNDCRTRCGRKGMADIIVVVG